MAWHLAGHWACHLVWQRAKPPQRGESQLEEGCPRSKKVLLTHRCGGPLLLGIRLTVATLLSNVHLLHSGPVSGFAACFVRATARFTLGGVVPPVAGGALHALWVLVVWLALPGFGDEGALQV